jgi:hypothetical protein
LEAAVLPQQVRLQIPVEVMAVIPYSVPSLLLVEAEAAVKEP